MLRNVTIPWGNIRVGSAQMGEYLVLFALFIIGLIYGCVLQDILWAALAAYLFRYDLVRCDTAG